MCDHNTDKDLLNLVVIKINCGPNTSVCDKDKNNMKGLSEVREPLQCFSAQIQQVSATLLEGLSFCVIR